MQRVYRNLLSGYHMIALNHLFETRCSMKMKNLNIPRSSFPFYEMMKVTTRCITQISRQNRLCRIIEAE